MNDMQKKQLKLLISVLALVGNKNSDSCRSQTGSQLVCDQLASGRSDQLATRFELSRHVEIARTWSQTGSQQVCDPLASWSQTC